MRGRYAVSHAGGARLFAFEQGVEDGAGFKAHDARGRLRHDSQGLPLGPRIDAQGDRIAIKKVTDLHRSLETHIAGPRSDEPVP